METYMDYQTLFSTRDRKHVDVLEAFYTMARKDLALLLGHLIDTESRFWMHMPYFYGYCYVHFFFYATLMIMLSKLKTFIFPTYLPITNYCNQLIVIV